MSDASWPADTGASERWPIYTRGNVGEVFPDVVLPLEWDIGGLSSERGWRRGAELVGFLQPDDYGPGEFVMLGVFGGYAYFNASLMRLLGVRAPGLSTDLIDQQFLGDAEVAPYAPSSGDRNAAASARMVSSTLKTLTARKVPLVDEMRRVTDAHIAMVPPVDASDDSLWESIRDGSGETWEFLIASHVLNTMQATIAAGALTDFCEAHLGDPNMAVTLTTGIGEVVSARPAQEMWRLANETSTADWDEAFAGFLRRWGHRGPNEFSLLGRDWAGHPEIAVAAIDLMRELPSDRSPLVQEELMARRRLAAIDDAHTRLGWRSRILDRLIRSTVLWSRAREDSKDQIVRSNHVTRRHLNELMRRAENSGGVPDRMGPTLLSADEFGEYLKTPVAMVSTIEQRRKAHEALRQLEPPFAFDSSAFGGGFPPLSTWAPRREFGSASSQSGAVLQGAAGAPGVAEGRVRVVLDPADVADMVPGEILVAPLTDPAWTPLFVAAAGVVVEVGAAMSHSMIVSRELGIPCVVGIEGATQRLVTGSLVEIDGQAGTVRVL